MNRKKWTALVLAVCLMLPGTLGIRAEASGPLGGFEPDEWGLMALYAAGEAAEDLPLEAVSNARVLTDHEAYLMGALSQKKRAEETEALISENQRPDGKFADFTDGTGEELMNAHIWGIISLECAGAAYDRSAARDWLLARQNEDGGFPIYAGMTRSDGDMTAMAVVALDLSGVLEDETPVERALAYVSENNQERETAEGLAWEIVARKQTGRPVGEDLWDRLEGFRLQDGTYLHLKMMSAANYIATWHGVWAEAERNTRLTVFDRFAAQNRLKDIGEDTPARGSILDLVDRGILSGYPDGTFRPGNPVKRGEFVKMLVYAMERESEQATSAGFRDMETHWARPYVDLAAREGFFNGTAPGVFDPESGITGAQLAAVAVRVKGLEAEALAYEGGDAWYSGYVYAAWRNDLLYSGFELEKQATRAQCAELIDTLY